MSTLDALDYSVCFDTLRRANVPFSPSEAHAMAVGMLSGGVQDIDDHWAKAAYADLEPGDVLAQECRQQLKQLFEVAVEQVRDESFGLQLFLPAADEAGMSASLALRDWVQGYLYGFGLAGEAVAQRLSAEGQEALRDLYEIGQLAEEEGELDEEAQQALVEIEEFVRVAAMLIHEDMHVALPAGD